MPFMNDTELARMIKEGNFTPVYFFFGKEIFLAEGYLKKIIEKVVHKSTASFNFKQFDGAELDVSLLQMEIEALPLMSDKKCVILKNPNIEKMVKDDFDILLQIVNNPNPTTVFIIFVSAYDIDLKKNLKAKKLCEAVTKNGVAVDFSPKTRSELAKIIKQRVSKNGSEIENKAIDALIERSGNSLDKLTIEIDKLTSYRPDGEITKKDVETVVGMSLEASVFDLSKSMLKNNYNRAFEILDDLFLAREEPLAILGVLNMTFVDLYRAKVAMLASKNAEDVCEIFSYRGKEFRIRNAFKDVPKYSARTLRKCLEILAEADIKLKTTKADGKIVVEKVLASILQLIYEEQKAGII